MTATLNPTPLHPLALAALARLEAECDATEALLHEAVRERGGETGEADYLAECVRAGAARYNRLSQWAESRWSE